MRKVFTLIELLVVVAIISVLMAMLLPGLSEAKKTAWRIACSGNLKQLGLCEAQYLSDSSDYYGNMTLLCFVLRQAEVNQYLKKPETLKCPAEQLTRATNLNVRTKACSYGMNIFIGGGRNYLTGGWYPTSADYDSKSMRSTTIQKSVQGFSGLSLYADYWIANNLWRCANDAGGTYAGAFCGLSTAYTGTTYSNLTEGPYYYLHAKGACYNWADGHVSYLSYQDYLVKQINTSDSSYNYYVQPKF